MSTAVYIAPVILIYSRSLTYEGVPFPRTRSLSPVCKSTVSLGTQLYVYIYICHIQYSEMKSLSHAQLCGPVDGSPSGSSTHGIFQARVLEWVAISFSRGSSQPRDRIWVSSIADRHFYRLSHQVCQCICIYMYICPVYSRSITYEVPFLKIMLDNGTVSGFFFYLPYLTTFEI